MLKIERLRIEVITAEGLFGADLGFKHGLNLIWGDNTRGKSIATQAIFYALGLEEILGAKNEKTMQPALRDVFEYDGKSYKILESKVILEVSGSSSISIVRYIKSDSKSSKLVTVYYGELLSGGIRELNYDSMYLHDAGAAEDVKYGFHAFLESFLGWDLPDVPYFQGPNRKLYLQTIFPSAFVEQKKGWTDFFATIPSYGIRNVKQRVIEFILGLDVHENQLRKQELQVEESDLKLSWKILFEKMQDLAKSSGFELRGIASDPEILTPSNHIFFQKLEEDENYIALDEYIEKLQKQYYTFQSTQIRTIKEKTPENEARLESLSFRLKSQNYQLDQLNERLDLEKHRLTDLASQLEEINSDLKKNKAEKKLKGFGADIELSTAGERCPTCDQPLKDSLLPSDIDVVPMEIDQNVQYLDAQRKIIESYMIGQKREIATGEQRMSFLKEAISGIRKTIRELKKELVSPENQLSEAEIEEKISVRRNLEFFKATKLKFVILQESLQELSERWKDLLTRKKSLPANFFSDDDLDKLKNLEGALKKYLDEFRYESESSEYFSISQDTYLPSIDAFSEKFGEKDYNIKFASSASDFVSVIIAYSISLMRVATEADGNHPGVLILDEPAQHSMTSDRLRNVFTALSKLGDSQVIVAATFKEEEESLKTVTSGLPIHFHHIAKRLIAPLA